MRLLGFISWIVNSLDQWIRNADILVLVLGSPRDETIARLGALVYDYDEPLRCCKGTRDAGFKLKPFR